MRNLPVIQSFPKTRGECLEGGSNAARPCPWSRCRYQLNESGTCTLDLADQGGLTLEEVGTLLGVTRERIRQIEHLALRKLRLRMGSLVD